MKFKTLILVLFGVLNLQNVVFANASVQELGNKVTFEESITPNVGAMLIAVKEGNNLDNSNIYAMEYENSDENGKVIFTFVMDEDKNAISDGKYDVYVKEDNKNTIVESMVYASVATRSAFLSTVKAITSVTDLNAIFQNTDGDYEIDGDNDIVLAAISCDMSRYNQEANAIMYEYITGLENGFSDVTITEFVRGYKLSQGVNLINNSDEINVRTILDEINLSFGGEEYSLKTEEEKAYIAKYIWQTKMYTSVETMQTAYNQGCALWDINNVRVDDIESTFSKYAALLEILSSTEYTQYTALNNKNTANTTIVTILKESPVENIVELKAVIGKGVTAQNAVIRGGSGSSGGYFGGGEKSSNDSSAVTAIPAGKGGYAFNDLKDAEWAAESITKLAEKKIVSGDENKNFRPNDLLKREEFITMLVNVMGIYNENAKCEFKDAEEGKWYYSYIASAYENGVMRGVSEDMAGIGCLLTRQDMVVLAKRATEGRREFVQTREMVTFADYDTISEYAREAVQMMYTSGIVSGMGGNKFDPHGVATRAQGAVLLYNLFVK